MALTKEQIVALINAKIAGQGSAVDVGGALPAILKGIIDVIPEGGGGSGSLEFVDVVAKPESYVSFELFVGFGFTEDVYSKLCSGEYAGFVTNDGSRYLIVATYPENVDAETPAGFAYCDANGMVYDVMADYANETIRINEQDGVSVAVINSLPESGSYSAQEMAEYGITKHIAQLINGGSIIGLAYRENLGAFYGVECAYGSMNVETGKEYTTIVIRSGDNRYKIRFAENGSAEVSVESVNGGGDGVVSLSELPDASMTDISNLEAIGLSEYDFIRMANGDAKSIVFDYADGNDEYSGIASIKYCAHQVVNGGQEYYTIAFDWLEHTYKIVLNCSYGSVTVTVS